MAKIERKTQKIFAGNAQTDELAVFGSMKTGNPIYTNEIESLQSSDYESGWEAGIVANEAPFLEEMNGIQYGFSKQLAYLFQCGIPEWDKDTEYFANISFCQINGVVYQSLTDNNIGNNPTTDTTNWQKFYAGLGLYSANTTYAKDFLVYSVTDGQVKFYLSLTDDNKGNDLTNTTYWQEISLGGGSGSGLEVGYIGLAFDVNETDNTKRKLNGQAIAINEISQPLLTYLKSLQALKPEFFTDESGWQAEATLNTEGLCGKFVIDESAGTIRLPKYPKYIIGGFDMDTTAPVVGNGISLGFTNGTANAGAMSYTGSSGTTVVNASPNFYGSNVATSTTGNFSTINGVLGVTTDPTKSGLVANLPSISSIKLELEYYIQIATGATTEVNITNQIELNNPYSLGDSKYSPLELNNASWLKSAGQWNSKSLYPAFYNWLLEKRQEQKVQLYTYTSNTGWSVQLKTDNPKVGDIIYGFTPITPCGKVQSVNSSGGFTMLDPTNPNTGSSGTTTYTCSPNFTQNIKAVIVSNQYTNDDTVDNKPKVLLKTEIDSGNYNTYNSDYDFILDTENETFRLPLLDGSESVMSDKTITLNLGASGTTYTATANGWFTFIPFSLELRFHSIQLW